MEMLDQLIYKFFGFLDNSVGIGEHPQHIEEVNKQVEKIAAAKEKLDVLDEFEPERGEAL